MIIINLITIDDRLETQPSSLATPETSGDLKGYFDFVMTHYVPNKVPAESADDEH